MRKRLVGPGDTTGDIEGFSPPGMAALENLYQPSLVWMKTMAVGLETRPLYSRDDCSTNYKKAF